MSAVTVEELSAKPGLLWSAVVTLDLHDGRRIGPSYVFAADTRRHPTDRWYEMMDEDMRTTHEVWLSQIQGADIEPGHCHGRNKTFRWCRGERADCSTSQKRRRSGPQQAMDL